MYARSILLIGEGPMLKEFSFALQNNGVAVTTAGSNKKALETLQKFRFEAIVFVVPVYWESVGELVQSVRKMPGLETIPIIYLGNFIESSDTIILQRQGVKTLTLGPVPTQEAVRFLLDSL